MRAVGKLTVAAALAVAVATPMTAEATTTASGGTAGYHLTRVNVHVGRYRCGHNEIVGLVSPKRYVIDTQCGLSRTYLRCLGTGFASCGHQGWT